VGGNSNSAAVVGGGRWSSRYVDQVQMGAPPMAALYATVTATTTTTKAPGTDLLHALLVT
jgi:hypothetical protein